MSANRKLKGLQVQKDNTLASFNVILRFMEECNDQTQLSAYKVRLEGLEKLNEEVKTVFMDLQMTDESSENVAAYLKEKIAYEKQYYQLKEFLVNKIDHDPENADRNSSRLNESILAYPSVPRVQLPKISLPRFSGDIQDWLAFRDLFVAMIHSSVELPTIEKFHYLRSQLEGEALQVISSLPLTHDNYIVAWDLLTQRYSDKKLLKRKQVQALFDLPDVKRENARELHDLVESFEKAMKAIDQVSQDSDYKHLLLIHLLSTRLDHSTRRSWEEESAKTEKDTIADLLKFLRRRVQILESTPAEQNTTTRRSDSSRLVSMAAVRVSEAKCFLCRGNHLLRWCPRFAALTSEEKDEEIGRHGLCRNCLGKGHTQRYCPSQFSCRSCGLRHHTTLCMENNPVGGSSQANAEGIQNEENRERASTTDTSVDRDAVPIVANITTTETNIEQRKGQVLLITAVVDIVDNNGKSFQARALLDSCSQACFISENLFQRMKLKHASVHQEIIGIAGGSTVVNKRVNAVIKSRINNYYAPLDFYVLSKITRKLPSEPINIENWNIPVDVQLADPGFWKPRHVDMVLGAEVFFDLFHPRGRISLGHGMPTLVNSELGWVVSGRIPRGHFITPTDWTVATGQKKTNIHRQPSLSSISSSDTEEEYTSC